MAEVRPLTIKDIPQAKELSDAEGWNQTLDDWHLLVTTPDNICLACVYDDNIIATATAMNYNHELAWIGMVLVHPEHRGKGLSRILLNELLQKLKHVSVVKLDATPAGWQVYRKMGFQDEYRINRMVAHNLITDRNADREQSVLSVNKENFEEIVSYDNGITGVNRKCLFEHLARKFPETAFVMKDKEKVKGFALGRAGEKYYQIGPLLADSTQDAKDLLLKSVSCLSQGPIVADIPEDKRDFMVELQLAGFQRQRHFIRMHFGNNKLRESTGNVFLISGPEFG